MHKCNALGTAAGRVMIHTVIVITSATFQIAGHPLHYPLHKPPPSSPRLAILLHRATSVRSHRSWSSVLVPYEDRDGKMEIERVAVGGH